MIHGERIETIKKERSSVYGPPRQNHRGISQMWASVLQPHWETIRRGDPVPEHVIALCMALLKINRMRLVYHEDNYDDAEVYLGFAKQWQGDHDGRPRPEEEEDSPY